MQLGFIGLGSMGGAMARNLSKAGHSVRVYDLEAAKIAACVEVGGMAADSAAGVVSGAEVVFSSLTDSATSVKVAEEQLLPAATAGQIFIETGTVMPAETRRLAAALAEKGATWLDVPVSGGANGAEQGVLRLFGGGDEAAFEQVRPLLEVIGDPQFIVYCGPSGQGQIVKFVNQMAAGLSAAAHLEALALGVKAGVPAELLRRALGGAPSGWRSRLDGIARRIAQDDGKNVGVKYGQMAYFLAAAEELGLELPLSRALHDFCAEGELLCTEANRLSPSFWHELMKSE